MLLKSGYSLESQTIRFVENNESITLFSAYLKLEQLKKINRNYKIKRIIVRWDVKDLCIGVSDIELYQYCLDYNIALYRNTRIHLKALWNNEQSLLFGSANITGRGIGEKGNYNYELNGIQENMSLEDICYLNEIIQSSNYVDYTLFEILNEKVSLHKNNEYNYPEIKIKKNHVDKFLLSQLPMTSSVEKLFLMYSSVSEISKEELPNVAHDISLYNIQIGLDRNDFMIYLKEEFNSHPFVLSLKKEIKKSERRGLNYGSVVKWIQNNTTTVPTPRSWHLKQEQIVNILYNWICYFDKRYTWDIPGKKSQIIKYHAAI